MKEHTIYVGLEEIESRYSGIMNGAMREMCDYSLPTRPSVINEGEFLDVFDTVAFKAEQLRMIAALLKGERVMFNREGRLCGMPNKTDRYVFVFADMFFPGIEAVRYMAELSGYKSVKIVGFNHAGRADPFDFVIKLGDWADVSENAWHTVCDRVLVGSELHKSRVKLCFDLENTEVLVTGIPWDTRFVSQVYPGMAKKEDYVIWCHRPCPEKGWSEFMQYAMRTDKRILITSSAKARLDPASLPSNVKYEAELNKYEYYARLASARWYLSTANQENFGYTLREAAAFGCSICVPNRACYPEVVPERCLYNDVLDIDNCYHELTVEEAGELCASNLPIIKRALSFVE